MGKPVCLAAGAGAAFAAEAALVCGSGNFGWASAHGCALPSSRELAKVLALSRNTVTAAYLQLVDDGFLESRPRSGVFVTLNARPVEVKSSSQAAASGKAAGMPPVWAARVLRSLTDQRTLSKPDRWSAYPSLCLRHLRPPAVSHRGFPGVLRAQPGSLSFAAVDA